MTKDAKRNTKKASTTTAVMLRLPQDMHRAIKHLAVEDGQTIGAVITRLLHASLAAQVPAR